MNQKVFPSVGEIMRNTLTKLGITQETFYPILAEQLGIDEDKARNYLFDRVSLPYDESLEQKKGEFYYDAFVAVVDVCMNDDIEIMRKWESMQVRIKTMFLLCFEDWGRFPEMEQICWPTETVSDIKHEQTKAEVLESIAPAFLALNPAEAYKIKENFDCYTTMSISDIGFMQDIWSLDKNARKRVQNFMLNQAQELTYSDLLSLLKSKEIKGWVEIGSKSYSNNCKGGKNQTQKSWKSFCKQAEKCSYERLAWFSILLSMFYGSQLEKLDASTGNIVNPRKAIIEKKDVDFLLIYKYCLTVDQREEVRKKIDAMH